MSTREKKIINFLKSKPTQQATSPNTCCLCGEEIEKGEYYYHGGEGKKGCIDCVEWEGGEVRKTITKRAKQVQIGWQRITVSQSRYKCPSCYTVFIDLVTRKDVRFFCRCGQELIANHGNIQL